MTKPRLIAISIMALAMLLVVAWLLPTENPRRNYRLRRSILLRCTSDLLFAWRDLGKLRASDVKRVLEAYDKQTNCFAIVWELDGVSGHSPFASVIMEHSNPVEHVCFVDLIREDGLTVSLEGYRWLTADELSHELSDSNIELRGDFIAQ